MRDIKEIDSREPSLHEIYATKITAGEVRNALKAKYPGSEFSAYTRPVKGGTEVFVWQEAR
jgi:hypothetical protein